jgi:hypothetical protein
LKEPFIGSGPGQMENTAAAKVAENKRFKLKIMLFIRDESFIETYL